MSIKIIRYTMKIRLLRVLIKLNLSGVLYKCMRNWDGKRTYVWNCIASASLYIRSTKIMNGIKGKLVLEYVVIKLHLEWI